jgi:hypothetical protein
MTDEDRTALEILSEAIRKLTTSSDWTLWLPMTGSSFGR